MTKKKTIDELKSEFVGKTFNWLTVSDVYRENGVTYFKCMCKCGNVKIVSKAKVVSNHTTSCGCYRRSKEKAEKCSQWCKEHPDKMKERAEKHSKWCKEHPDELKEQAQKFSQWCKDNPDKISDRSNKYRQWINDNPNKYAEKCAKHSRWHKEHPEHSELLTKLLSDQRLQKRKLCDWSTLLTVLHPKHKDDLINGNISAKSLIETKCPLCNKYDTHRLNNVFRISTGKFRSGSAPLCNECTVNKVTSKYEKEVADYIAEFTDDLCLHNDRDLLNGKELDLYYPSKKIAIEFNGDYFHSETNNTRKDYHVNKFRLCKENGILLVSIFESYWKIRKDEIKNYIKDLFNGVENKLSFNEDKTLMNNNYPSPYAKVSDSIIEDYYVYDKRNDKVFTCGFSKVIKE